MEVLKEESLDIFQRCTSSEYEGGSMKLFQRKLKVTKRDNKWNNMLLIFQDQMEESIGPEWRDLLIYSYINSTLSDCDDLWQQVLHGLMLLQLEDDGGGDSDLEELQQESLLLRHILLEVSRKW